MAISEVRTQIYLERAQHAALKRAAKARGVSMAQVVREAIARHLASADEPQVEMITEAMVPHEELLVTKGGTPIARLVPLEKRSSRILGQDQGLFETSEDFDDPLPEHVLASFED